MSPTGAHEVIVLGAGPAGCAAATLLARHGHDVCLVRPPALPAGSLAESIPPSARKVLADLGLERPLDRAGLHSNGGNAVHWAGRGRQTQDFAQGRLGFHTDRARLEDVLVAAAREAGARVLEGASAGRADERTDGWRIHCADEHRGRLELRARWVLDATGRRGVIARREGRETDRSTTTTALVRRWRRPGGFTTTPATHTLVESYVDGWAWSVPLGAEVRCVTAMVDHRHTSLVGGELDGMLDGELRKAPDMAALLEGAQPLGPAWACPASLHTARRFARQGLLLVGDAGSFIDPLSSFGVKKALSSGWLAGVAVHTALVDSEMTDAALRLYDEREREVYRSSRALSATFFEEAGRAYDHPYWTVRAESARAAARRGAPHDSVPQTVNLADALAGEADGPGDTHGHGGPGHDVSPGHVRTAFERIRARDRLDARLAADVRVVERPCVVGHRVVRERHLSSGRVPLGLRWVRSVDLLALSDAATAHDDVADGWRAYNAVAAPVPLPDYLTALSTAFAAGFLEHDDGSGASRAERAADAVGATT